jgi:hypothetical protein
MVFYESRDYDVAGVVMFEREFNPSSVNESVSRTIPLLVSPVLADPVPIRLAYHEDCSCSSSHRLNKDQNL